MKNNKKNANKVAPIVFTIHPTAKGKLRLVTGDNRVDPFDNALEVDNLYVAMEGSSRISEDIGVDIVFKTFDAADVEKDPIVYNIAVNIEGKYFLYTHDKRIVDIGCVNAILVDNMYTAMEGLTRRYREYGVLVFKTDKEYC